jgi:hypothetical protein
MRCQSKSKGGVQCGLPEGHYPATSHSNASRGHEGSWVDAPSVITPQESTALNKEPIITSEPNPTPANLSPSLTATPTPGVTSHFALVYATLLQCQRDISDVEQVLVRTQYKLSEIMEKFKK